jgi:hypothetical protein
LFGGEKECSHSFNGTDFINNCKYDKVKNIFNLLLNEKPLFFILINTQRLNHCDKL